MFTPRDRLGAFVLALATVILVATLATRVYCAYWTVPIVTWDDRDYRLAAAREGSTLRLSEIPSQLLGPQRDNLSNRRSRGYHVWIASAYALTQGPWGKRAFGELDQERVWQTVNMIALCMQLALVYAFGRWSSGRRSFGVVLAALFATTPIVFGINRWIMTENHALTALLCLSMASSWYITTSTAGLTTRRCLVLVAMSLMFGVFSSLREYGAPALAGALALVCSGLALQRRWSELIAFVGPLVPYLAALAAWLPRSLAHLSKANDEARFFHPLSAWVPHAFLYAVGPALSLFLAALVGMSVRALVKEGALKRDSAASAGSRTDHVLEHFREQPIDLAILVQGALLAAYGLGVIQTVHRTMRPTLTLISIALPLALLLLHRARLAERAHWVYVQWASVAALGLGVWVWSWQLLVAFEGGAAYAHHPTNMEYYNHPAHLQPLPDHPRAMHVSRHTSVP